MFQLRKSTINNIGVFATQNILKDTIIGVWITKEGFYKRRSLYQIGMECMWFETDVLGRYCNHSMYPNTTITTTDSDITLISNGINSGEEILVNYLWVQEITGYKVDLSRFDQIYKYNVIICNSDITESIYYKNNALSIGNTYYVEELKKCVSILEGPYPEIGTINRLIGQASCNTTLCMK